MTVQFVPSDFTIVERVPPGRPMLVPASPPPRGPIAMLHLMGALVLAQGRSGLQYRFATIAWFLIQGSAYAAEFAAVYLLVQRFEHVRSWVAAEVLVVYALVVLAYGISGFFFQGTMVRLETLVHQGQLDLYLIKPVNPLLHMVCRTFNAGYTTHVLLSTTILIGALRALDVEWSATKTVYLLLAAASGALVQCAVWLGTGSAAFWLTRVGNVQSLLLHQMRDLSFYPVSIYGRAVQTVLTVLLPWAFVGYYPAVYLLDRPATPAEQLASLIAPAVGLVSFAVAYRVWKRGLNAYQGGGA